MKFLNDDAIRQELRKGNYEVLLVTAFAIQPTLFEDKVEVLELKGGFKFIVKDTGNSYFIHNLEIMKIATDDLKRTGQRPEILKVKE